MCINSALKNRKIYLNEDINEDSAFKVLYWLDKLETIDIKDGNKDDIEIIISSGGGCAYSTLMIISKIRSMIDSGYNIITTVQAIAFSGAFWILCAGSLRRAYKNSRIMTHNILSGTVGKHQDILDDLEEIEAIWKRLKEVVTSYTYISDEKMEEIKKCKFDWFFWGDEAIELGVVDEIL
jgi:ATP-dependent Clp protease protease subunit